MLDGRCVARFIVIAGILTGATAAAQSTNDLKSFYITNWGGDILSVEPVGADVRLRLMNASKPDLFCPALIVSAIETMLPRTTVRAVAGVNMCAMSSERVTRALARAPRAASIDFLGSQDVFVADCGASEKVFVFRLEAGIVMGALKRRAPDVVALWDVADRLRDLVISRTHRSQFFSQSFEVDPAAEAHGTSLIPELLSGKYDTAFNGYTCRDDVLQQDGPCKPSYLAWLLKDYSRPPQERGMLPPNVVDRESLGLISYVTPTWPPIALAARVFGEVRLRLNVDADGTVTDVQALSGPQLYVPAAIDAARRWRFAASAGPRPPIETTVQFQKRCPQ